MKRAIILLLSLILTLQLFSCTANETGTPETTPTPSEPVSFDGVDSWLSHGTLKISGRTRAPREAVKSASVSAAKNESESVQLSFRSDENIEGLSLNVIGNAEGITPEIFEEYLIPTGATTIPDAIVPLTEEFSLVAEETKTFLVRFCIGENAASGEHKYTVQLCHGKSVVESYDITLNVMSFSLPREYFTPVYTKMDMNEIMKKEGITRSKLKDYYKKYYEMLLDYGVTCKGMPYDILDDRADEYMSDPRITCFAVDPKLSDEELLQVYEKLKTNPEWMKKAEITVYDEPTSIDMLDEYIRRASRVHELCPELAIYTAYFRNIKYSETEDTVDVIARYSDDFCVKSCAWGDGWLADPLKKGNFAERIRELAGEDGTVLWYVCWEPKEPYCNLQLDEAALNHRVLFWQQYFYDVDGLTYWYANYWKMVSDPWTDMATVKDLSDTCYGDGSLMYPGKKVGVNGPVASLRLDCMRDGIEDFALLKLAERELGRDWVIERVSTVTPSVSEHTKDTNVFAPVRAEILTALNEKLG